MEIYNITTTSQPILLVMKRIQRKKKKFGNNIRQIVEWLAGYIYIYVYIYMETGNSKQLIQQMNWV